MKIFKEEIKLFLNKIKKDTPFSLCRFGDGEWMAINNIKMDNNEFTVDNTESAIKSAFLLKESILYKDENYYIGIGCPCCSGDNHYTIKKFCKQKEQNITYANIFVNSNYSFYNEHFIEEFRHKKINLIANENANISNLPFKVKKFFPVKKNAWINNISLIEEISNMDIYNEIFLMCCGPLANILCHQLWIKNKNNIYLDVGSTLDKWIGIHGFARGYILGSSDINKVCHWSN